MSFPGFYALSFAWLGLLIAPLILFYFLKLKRPKLAIPSLVLWQQVINDSRVNSPFQRFKRNILLLLQLLLLILLVLAAMQPYWRTQASEALRLPILIDRSASMAALDEPGGQSRLDVAKEQVRDIIDGLGPEQELALIAFAKSAQRMAAFTSNKRVLHEALDQIQIHDVTSDVGDALRMADAMARTFSFDRVLLISDGNFPAQIDFALPFQLDYERLSPAGANLGITALNARRRDGGGWNVFVRVQGTDDWQASATIQLIQDGEKHEPESVVLQSGKGQRLRFAIKTDEHTSLELRLNIDGFDSLASDNRAFLELSPTRPLSVYTAPSLAGYRHALESMKNLRLFPDKNADNAAGLDENYDLIITDKFDEPEAEAHSTLYVGVVPDDLTDLLEVAPEYTTVIDWRRTSNLLEYVELTDVDIFEDPHLRDNVKEEDLENLHYEAIMYGRNGPLMLQKRDGLNISTFMLFHSDRSDLRYRIGFPIFISNLVRIATHQAGLLEVRGDQTGVLPPLSLVSGMQYEIRHLADGETLRGPRDSTRHEIADEQGVLAGVPAPHVGSYVIRQGGAEKTRIGVSLLQARESLLGSVEQIELRESKVQAADTARVDRSLWSILALLALFVLLLEWWFFQRRSGRR